MDLSDREIFRVVIHNTRRNIPFYVGWFAVILATEAWVHHWVAIGVFALFVVVAGLNTIHGLMTAGLGIFTVPVALFHAVIDKDVELAKDQGYLAAATIVQIVENLLYIGLAVYAFWWLF